jgi:hypothetical protein
MYGKTRYGATLGGHEIELEFDTSKVVLNTARLRVDGTEVDSTHVFYGEKELTTKLDDGSEVLVAVHSGMVGEATRIQAKGPDGTWTDLVERS